MNPKFIFFWIAALFQVASASDEPDFTIYGKVFLGADIAVEDKVAVDRFCGLKIGARLNDLKKDLSDFRWSTAIAEGGLSRYELFYGEKLVPASPVQFSTISLWFNGDELVKATFNKRLTVTIVESPEKNETNKN